VIIPKGTAWQYLRSLCFDAIPAEATAHYTSAIPLYQWRLHGSFLVTACTKKSITLLTSGVEIGAGLLADVEFLLDHAAEQRATVRNSIVELSWHSPAWSVVTAYYWCFFSAMAITRITGRTTWFLDRAALSELRQLAGTTTQPRAGALNLTLGPYVSAMDREIILQPSRAHLHDSLWNVFHGLVAELFNRTDQTANSSEYRLWWCLHEARLRLGADWPSEIRNIVNYRPGCAYREVIRNPEIDIAPFIRRNSPFTPEGLISKLEDELLKIKAGTPAPDQVPLLCRVLLLFAITASSIAEELHFELIGRAPADRRWSDLRRRFLQQRCATRDVRSFWPFGREI